jgi:hypothetical protein
MLELFERFYKIKFASRISEKTCSDSDPNRCRFSAVILKSYSKEGYNLLYCTSQNDFIMIIYHRKYHIIRMKQITHIV